MINFLLSLSAQAQEARKKERKVCSSHAVLSCVCILFSIDYIQTLLLIRGKGLFLIDYNNIYN